MHDYEYRWCYGKDESSVLTEEDIESKRVEGCPLKPMVEVIPVEWLLNHIPKDEVMQRYNEKLIEYLVIEWREEE